MSERRPPEGNERRRTERVAIKIPVDYSAVDAFFTEFSANINKGGIFIETEEPDEPETLVALQFRLPGRESPVSVMGRVAWVSDGKDGSPAGMGVEFHDLDSEVREIIDDVVRNLRVRS